MTSAAVSAEESATLICETCGSMLLLPKLRAGQALRCGRCAEIVLVQRSDVSFQAACALGFTALLLAVLANLYPILTFNVAGNTQSNLIVTGGLGLGNQGYWSVAALVLFCAIIAPVLHNLAVVYVAAACSLKMRFPMVHGALRMVEFTHAWSLIPVFAVACVVAVIKLDMIGTVNWQVGIWWIALLSLCSLAQGRVFDARSAHRRLEEMA